MYPTNVFIPDSPQSLPSTSLPFDFPNDQYLKKRPRRNRKSPAIRSLIQETRLHATNFICPLFILEGNNLEQPVLSMPGVSRKSLDLTLKEIEEISKLGIQAIDLFPVINPSLKDRIGSEAIRPNNLTSQFIRTIKKEFPQMCIIVDVALDPFTDHGHDGVVNDRGDILNDETLIRLGQMSLCAAEAGADIVAPSDMMDGRVAYIRHILDNQGHTGVNILSYTAKYASAFYGPFRDALQSAPKFGNKKTYQMDPANSREALLEASLDEAEGADFLLVKPALPYLDIITKIKENTSLPVGAYHVSGEYSMVMAAAEKGWINADSIFLESLTSIKRAGAEFILTYAAKRIAKLLNP